MSGDSPVGSRLNKFVSYAFMLLAAAFMLSWAWELLKPLVPIIVVSVALALGGAAAVRHLVNRDQRW